jgi:hypothetical protein
LQITFPPPSDGASASNLLYKNLLRPSDPNLSQGAECINVNADNIYDIHFCSLIEKHFFQFYAEVYDEHEKLGEGNLVTSWTNANKFTFTSDASVFIRGGYLAIGNVSVSEDFRNASLLFKYSESDVSRIYANILTFWETVSFSEGDVNYVLEFSESINDSYETLCSTGFLQYTLEQYAFGMKLYENEISMNTVGVAANGTGRYSGTLQDW